MKIDKFKHADNWQDVKDATMNTIGKNTIDIIRAFTNKKIKI